MFEHNLEELLGVKFLASEYATTHGGRIDALGIDEDDSPVIIEHKRDEKDNVINQGLFYLDWLVDHKGDFELLVKQKLKRDITINWESPRLVSIAQSFNKYDKYAVHKVSENIELKRYASYGDNLLLIENVNLPEGKKVRNQV